jgi:phage shock protein C
VSGEARGLGEGIVPKRLVRDTRHGVIGGVAAGLGQYLNVDPVLVRLAFVLLFFANGFGLLAYLICWVVVPRAEPTAPAVSPAATAAAEQGLDAVRAAGARVADEVRSAAHGVHAAAENARAAAPDPARAQAVIGGLLVVSGALLLADNLGWLRWPYWANIETLWPLLLVGLGVGLIVKSQRSATTA